MQSHRIVATSSSIGPRNFRLYGCPTSVSLLIPTNSVNLRFVRKRSGFRRELTYLKPFRPDVAVVNLSIKGAAHHRLRSPCHVCLRSPCPTRPHVPRPRRPLRLRLSIRLPHDLCSNRPVDPHQVQCHAYDRLLYLQTHTSCRPAASTSVDSSGLKQETVSVLGAGRGTTRRKPRRGRLDSPRGKVLAVDQWPRGVRATLASWRSRS